MSGRAVPLAAAVQAAAEEARPSGQRAVMWDAGGTPARAYARFFPSTRIDAVDIDGPDDRLPLIIDRVDGSRSPG